MLASLSQFQRLVILLVLPVAAQSAFAQTERPQSPETVATDAAQPSPPAESPQNDDWARQFLQDDPLAALQQVTLDDLRDGLADSRQQSNVIARHFPRVIDATDDQKIAFLVDAMRSTNSLVQRQAAVELQAMNALESAVRDLLVEFLASEDPIMRSAAVVGLELIEIPSDQRSDEYWTALVEAIGDPDFAIAQSAARQLKDQGASSVPVLLNALRNQHPRPRLLARVLSEIVGSKSIRPEASVAFAVPDGLGELPGPRTTVAKSASVPEPTHTIRDVDPTRPTSVTVYFGTNRELIDKPQRSWNQLFQFPLLAFLLLAALIPFFTGTSASATRATGDQHRRGCLRWVLPLILVCGAGWSMLLFRSELQQHWQLRSGAGFGPRRDAAESVHYGTCRVSIPPRHKVGVVERPLIGPENEQEHVVLKEIEKLAEDAFFELVKSKVAELPRENRSCFVFIHGFNVDFDSAARRTAQMHYDLKFESVPIFFSWPSRGNVRHYFSDRNEIEFSRYVIKEFLSDVAKRVEADRIHVIAHSMGADATCRAIADLGDRGKIFDQIILAAPDIDSEVFRVQIAPRMTQTANRTTLYCSKNDWALMLSRNFNDSMRAGDSSGGALVLPDVDTIDASEIDTDLLGHSYYGDCLPILDDVNLLMRSSLPPLERRLRPWPVDEQLLYWTLPDAGP